METTEKTPNIAIIGQRSGKVKDAMNQLALACDTSTEVVKYIVRKVEGMPVIAINLGPEMPDFNQTKDRISKHRKARRERFNHRKKKK